MSYAYIGAAAVVGILIGFVTLAVLWICKTVQENIRNRTLELLTDYEDLLADRSRELALLEQRLAQAAKEVPVEAEQKVVQEVSSDVAPMFVLKSAERISTTAYRDTAFISTYREIQNGFSTPPQEIFEKLPQGGAGGEGGPATRLLAELDFDTVYNLATLPGAEQHQLLTQVLSQEALAVVEQYGEKGERFDSLEFYSFLKGEAEREPGATVIRVPVGLKPQGCPPHSVVVEDEGICEGIQVELGNNLYDFCIKAREIG